MCLRRCYDICIVGSGAGGGMPAYMLTRAGADVVIARGRADVERGAERLHAQVGVRLAAARRVDSDTPLRRVRRVHRGWRIDPTLHGERGGAGVDGLSEAALQKLGLHY
jgi:choline dehydrogenase-like flavoprotein